MNLNKGWVMNLEQYILLLKQKKEFCQELYDVICSIANQIDKSSELLGAGSSEDSSGLVGEFIARLANPDKTLYIRSKSDLQREFRRFCTEVNSPERHELWGALSSALLDLERNGKVVRPQERQRGRNNSNDTEWSLCRAASFDVDCQHHVAFSPKGEKNRIVNPTEAKKLVLNMLNEHEVLTMGMVFEKSCEIVPLMKRPESMDEAMDDEDGDSSSSLHERIAGKEVFFFPSDIIEIEDQADRRTTFIWERAGEVCKGRKVSVSGRSVLCRYSMPKYTEKDAKVRLEDLGPSSTVQEVAKEIDEILHTALLLESGSSRWSAKDERFSLEVISRVIEQIRQLCSENGHCPALR
jgi:hypothetical protein